MEPVPLSERDENWIFQQALASYDVPAYVRRGRRVEGAFQQLLEQCQQQREEWLMMVRLQLGTLHAQTETWEVLLPVLAGPEHVGILRQLHEELQPRLRFPVLPTTSPRVWRRGLRELRDSLQRFNRRWGEYVEKVDLTEVNDLREGYNRYYVLEKECATRSARLARAGFTRLPPVTVADLLARLPLLPVPEPRG
jgi:hypothetical protein